MLGHWYTLLLAPTEAVGAVAVWDYELSNGLTAEETLVAMAARIYDIWQRLGLDPANPQVTTATSIVAGGVDQTIAETAGPTITVTRNP